MDPTIIVAISVALMLVLLFLSVPIAFALALAGAVGLALLRSTGVALDTLGMLPYTKSAIYLMTVVPMFLLMGNLAVASGLGKDAYGVANKWIGHLPGGLGMATIAACAVFGAVSGSSMAEASAMGKITIPEMRKYGYKKELASALVACAALTDMMIPPSIGFVVYGFLSGESIGKLLIAGFIPGFFTAFCFAVLLFVMAKVRPNVAPRGVKATWSERLGSLPGLLMVGLLFMVAIGGIYVGVFTPTEGGAIGATVAFIMAVVALLRKRTSWSEMKQAFLDTAHVSSMIMFLFIGAGIFTLFLAQAGVPELLRKAVSVSGLPPIVIVLIIVACFLPLGGFLDPNSIMLLTIPIVYPVIIALGFNGIWFGVIAIKLMEISFITPPIGLNVFVIHSVAPDVPLMGIYRSLVPFLLMEFVTLGILIAFPQISLWLPGMMK